MSKRYANHQDWADWAAAKAEEEACGHTEVYSNGYCADCEEPVPDFEPTDAAIFAQHGQTKEQAA